MSILRKLLNEDVVERLIRHAAQQSALLRLEINKARGAADCPIRPRDHIRVQWYTSRNGALTGL